jgi:hypothetical protein
MKTEELNEFNKIKENWEIYLGLVNNKIANPIVREPLQNLCRKVEDRLASCPASTKTEYIGAFLGGLVWHSLNVLKTMKDLNKIYEAKYNPDTLILVSLFHDIGKIGDEEEDYYLPNQSDWHKKNGILYEINKDLPNTSVQTRTIWWLNNNNVPLSEYELHAIISLGQMGQMFNNDLYNVPLLTMMLQEAIRFCSKKHKNYTSVLG